MKQYKQLVQNVLDKGTRKVNRTGVDTISTFGEYYEVDLAEGFPLLTTKEVSWKNVLIENLWFLSGSPSIELLQAHGCKFWNPWADENGLVPSAYGNFWRNHPTFDPLKQSGEGIKLFELNDQIEWVLRELKHNPNSRRMVVSAWSPANAQTSALPPCHVMWILNVQETEDGRRRLNLHLTQRSCDVALGVPYNLAGYSFLLCLFAHFSGIEPGIFAHSLVDAHIYTAKKDGSMSEYDHVPGLKEQISRECLPLPKLTIDPSIRDIGDIQDILEKDTDTLLKLFKIEDYVSHPAIKFKVAV